MQLPEKFSKAVFQDMHFIAVFEDKCIKNYEARQASDVALWKVDHRGREG